MNWDACARGINLVRILVRKYLGIPLQNPPNPNIVLIDGNQLLYHIPWPVAGIGKLADVADGMKERIKDDHVC